MPHTWLLAALAAATGVGIFALHSAVQPVSFGDGVPVRHLIHPIGTTVLLVAVFGLILNVADAVGRDRETRLDNLIGSRPVGSFVVLAGRVVAQVLVAWLAVLAAIAATVIFEATVRPFGADAGGFEPVSTAAFALLDAPLWLAFWCSLTVLAGEILGRRLHVCGVVLVVLAAAVWGLLQTPYYLVSAVTGVHGFATIASDLMPRFADEALLLRHACTVLVAVGFVAIAAAICRRRNGILEWRGLVAGTALVNVGAVGVLVLVAHAVHAEGRRQVWSSVHTENVARQQVDLRALSAFIRINPGRELVVDAELTLKAQTADAAELVLSFNPGMSIGRLTVDGRDGRFTHDEGLLRVTLAADVSVSEVRRLRVRAAGIPDPRFAYLDDPFDARKQAFGNSQIHLLGTEALLFEDSFVALLPGTRWLPMPGRNAGTEDPSRGQFFGAAVQVDVPQGWLVAGPGKRTECTGVPGTPDRHCFQFTPAGHIPDVALVAGRFSRRSVEVDGVTYEFLAHRDHALGLGMPSTLVQGAIAASAAGARRAGIPYPYDSFSLVEVPRVLRTYGGGWRLRNVQSLPGLMLVKEGPYPWLHGRWAWGAQDDVPWRAKFERVARDLARDVTGGDVVHASQNLLRFQTAAEGQAAAHVQGLVDALVDVALPPSRRHISSVFHSPYLFNSPPGSLGGAVADLSAVAERAVRQMDRPATWELALSPRSWAGQPTDPSTALAAAALRERLFVNAVVDLVGDATVGRLLATMRRSHTGRHFSAAEFETLARSASPGLGQMARDWIESRPPPGFVVSPPEVHRLEDDKTGRPRYQILAHVRNAEPGPGVVRLWCFADTPYDPASPSCSVVARIPGHQSMELGVLADGPPLSVAVDTYLSRNRGTVHLQVPEYDATASSRAVPFVGARPSVWQPTRDGIIVDDLDRGFEVEPDPESRLLDAAGTQLLHAPVTDLDQGIPVSIESSPSLRTGWSRSTSRWSWGKYRRTHARHFGKIQGRAVFETELRPAGLWRLDYHMPGRVVRGTVAAASFDELGQYEFVITVADRQANRVFDGNASRVGWNHVGDFDLPAGTVRLTVANASKGSRLLVADAVRWRRLH